MSNLKIGLEQVLLSEIVCYANIAITSITKSLGGSTDFAGGSPLPKA